MDIICELPKYQDHFINGEDRIVAIIAGKGTGKAQPLTEPVLTPDGFLPMGELKIGDKVIGSDGKPCSVVNIFPQGEIDQYKVTMSDNTFTYCSGDHLWAVQTGGQKHRKLGFKVKTTLEIADDLNTRQGYNKWYMPLVKPVKFSKKKFVIPPYSMGAILGDSGLTNRCVMFSTKDKEILDRISKECKIDYKYYSGCDYRLTNMDSRNHLVQELRRYGLMGLKSDKKFIPDEYFYGSASQRKNLLRGLMDTDGYVDKKSGVGEFCTTSERLAYNLVGLCRSLGLTPRLKKRTQKVERYLDFYIIRVNAPFNPFWIKRKADLVNIKATQGRSKSIQKIERAGRAEMQCIRVDSTDSLYVTRNFILTHNTFPATRFVAKQIAEQPGSQGIVMMNSRQQAEDIFFQNIEPMLQELNWPYEFNGQKLNLRVFGTRIHIRSADPEAVKKIESIEYSWGWADEASYFPTETLRTFVSRIRKGLAKVRITSMPDEPDAYIYSFIEKLIEMEGGKMYELGLKDNPDKEFRERYERFLRSIYQGAQLERFLDGKRVSLEGEGLFAVESHMRGSYGYNPEDEMLISWDFNVEYRAVSAWQNIGYTPEGLPKIACVKSWKLKGATVYEDAEALGEWLTGHKNLILVHGDASGESRTAQATDSMWKTIRDTFDRKKLNYHYIVPKSNPLVKDTIQCLNWALREGLVVFDENEGSVYSSLQAMKADKYGEIDKTIDYKADSSVRSHPADTARYASYHYFQHLYPGNQGGFFVV